MRRTALAGTTSVAVNGLLGIIGRRRMNAVFFESHAVDRSDGVVSETDLTPLVKDASLGIADYVDGIVSRFRGDVQTRLRTRLGR